LSDELSTLVRRAGALVAVVIDAHSPVIWGASTKSMETLASNPRSLLLHPSDLTAEFERLGLPTAASLEEAEQPADEPPASRSNVAPKPESPASATHSENDVPGLRSQVLAAEEAITVVRALPELESLHKGGHLHYQATGTEGSLLARSFAAIYVLILFFDGKLDELRAKRAIVLALPVIERLVLALPPLDPGPSVGGAAAIRLRPQKRR
jgi:hypothetical protein